MFHLEVLIDSLSNLINVLSDLNKTLTADLLSLIYVIF